MPKQFNHRRFRRVVFIVTAMIASALASPAIAASPDGWMWRPIF